ncbi:bifunctional aspartate transaminase/aspartate 4-decarboxylase [Streptomyces sp. NPDC006733]|uniref:bifunctional aspartate transaminase/aspartate 4-decarboxylase n=1 Tax=Streptomyces sp. NPDC006733 TaxID=3155460 RepID=UPI0033E1632F
MTASTTSREQMRELGRLSPFELKDELIKLADKSREKNARAMLNAGRGNPNWVATGPREAFAALLNFGISESRRVWTMDNLGGMPASEGSHERFTRFVHANPGMPGIPLLARCVAYGIDRLGFVPDAWVHELADSVIGDNYPVPDRMLHHVERVVRAYLDAELTGGRPPAGTMDLFATEGGTAAMCYTFDSLMQNGILHKGDKIALMVPIFNPYIEVCDLDRFSFDVVTVEADMWAEEGVRMWRYSEEQVAKLADPAVKAVCLVNPSNPPSMALSDRVSRQIQEIVRTSNPNLVVITDDVYGTFVEDFRSLAADLPRNTLLVYSWSKHYGATGWRLGVIGLNEDNVIDEMIANLPAERKAELDRRYGTLTLEPSKIKFIDRLVADSRDVALNHTAGLSLPQQVQMALFSLFDLDPEGQEYKALVRSIVLRRLDLLLEGSTMKISDDPQRAGYYIELDLMAEAERVHGPEFGAYLRATYEPIDPLFRLAEQTSVVLLPGGGFDGPQWSVRVSLANLDDLDYLKIGHQLHAILEEYHTEWQATKA